MTETGTKQSEHVAMDVFTCDPFQVDLKLFKKWTKGVPKKEAAEAMIRHDRKKYGDFFSSPEALAVASVGHQYNFFRLLGEKLERPAMLFDNLELHIPQETQQKVVNLYYAFDDSVAKLLVGRKLTANLRKDVDDIAEAAKIPQDSCLRQFDNLRRVIKAVDSESKRESATPAAADGTVAAVESTDDFLKRRFRFSDHLVAKYKPFVFMALYKPRFNDKRIQTLSYESVEALANALMKQWTRKDGNLDLLVHFTELRDLKTRLKKDTGGLYKREVHNLMKSRVSEDVCRTIDGHFMSIVKALARIAADVADGREFDEMLINLLENVVDPMYKIDKKVETLSAFFTALKLGDTTPSEAILAIFNCKHSPASWVNWRMFLCGMQDAAIILHTLEPH